jgi:hypothetical protein
MSVGDVVEYADNHKHLVNKPDRRGRIEKILGGRARVHWDGNKTAQSIVEYLKEITPEENQRKN